MSVIVAIETSTAVGTVALGRGAELLGQLTIGESRKQNEALLPAIHDLLDSAGVSRSDLGGVVIGGGPGSFTGLRVAAATAKGFVHALGIPMHAYSGLLAAALEVAGARAVCALFDARREEVYSATYLIDGAIETRRAARVETIEECLRAQEVSALAFVGDGALRHRRRIEQLGGMVMEPDHPAPRASALLELLVRAPQLGAVPDARHWEPDYLRASGAERGLKS